MSVKLTDRLVMNLAYDFEAAKVNDVTWDTLAPGLGLKVGKSGRKTWLVQFYPPGKRTQSRRVLGPYPGLSLEDARVRCREWLDMVRLGQDPEAVRQAKAHHGAHLSNATFGKAAADYIANARKLGLRHVDQDGGVIGRHLVKQWGERSLASITKQDVGDRLKSLKPAVGYNAFNLARQIFNFAIDGTTDYGITTSPFDRLKPRALGLRKRVRDRVLDDDELAALWRASSKLEYPERHFYRWLLLTGCRLDDAGKAHWRELNLARRTWSIPPERFKSKAAHVVPITDTMLELLDTIPHRAGWVFSYGGEKPINSFSKLKRTVDALMGNPAPWVNHDLRRVVRSHLSALGVADHVAEMVCGRGRKGVQRIYDRHRYEVETRAALEAWHKRLAELTGNGS